MTITALNALGNHDAGTGAVTTGSFTSTAGSTIIVAVNTFATGTPFSAGDITDSKGNTYLLAIASTNDSPGTATYYNVNGTRGASHTVTYNGLNGTAGAPNIAVLEVSSNTGLVVFDPTTAAVASDNTSPFQVTTAAAIGGSQVAVMSAAFDNSDNLAWTNPSGYTTIYEEHNGGIFLVSGSWYKIGETGTPTVGPSHSGTVGATGGREAIVTFQEGVAFGSVADTVTTTTSLVATMPSGIVAGNALVAFFSDDSGSDTPTFTGWTLLTSSLYNSTRRISIYGRIATGSEGASMTMTGLTANFAEIVIFRYTGTDTTSPFNAYAVAPDTAVVPSITSTVNNCVQVAVSDWDAGSNSSAAPSGFTARYNPGTGNFYGADRALGTAGATATSDWTATGTAGGKSTATVALQPLGTYVPPTGPAPYEAELGWVMGSPRSHIGNAPLGARDEVTPAATPEQGFVMGDYNTHVGSSYIGGRSWAVAPEQGLVMGSPLSHIGAAYLGYTDVLNLTAFWNRWSLVTWQTKSLPIIPGTGRDSKVERMWETGQLPSYSGSAFTSKMYVRTGGAWVLNTVTPKVRVGGVWVDATAVHVRIAGAWVQVQ